MIRMEWAMGVCMGWRERIGGKKKARRLWVCLEGEQWLTMDDEDRKR